MKLQKPLLKRASFFALLLILSPWKTIFAAEGYGI